MEPFPQHSQFAPASNPQHPQSTPTSTPHLSQLIVGQQSQFTNGSSSGEPQVTDPSHPQNPQFTTHPNAQPHQPATKTRNAGRKKIKIAHIEDDRSRQVTFLKRKNGILKKAHELSVLCGCDVHAIVFNNDNGKLYEYFNPSATETLLRYATYAGPSERRCSDVTDLEGSKEDADIPNDEPELASAAAHAANMAVLRHAHPENYEHPPAGVKRIHPNVGVPRVTIPPPPTPVHAPMVEISSRASCEWPNSGAVPVNTQTPSSSHRSFHMLASGATPKNFLQTVRVPSAQPLATPENIEKSGNGYYSSTPIQTPQSTRPLPFHFEQQPVTPHTGKIQIVDRHGPPSIVHNEPFNEVHNDKPPNLGSPSECVKHTLEVALQRQSLGSTCTMSSPERGDPAMPPVNEDLNMNSGDSDTDIANLNNPREIASVVPRSSDPASLTAHHAINSAAVVGVRPFQASSTASLIPWSGSNTTPGRSTPRTPAGEPWNSPFFRQQMQHFQSPQQELPPLAPFLAELQHHAQEHTSGTTPLLREAGLDALSSPPSGPYSV